MKYPKLRKHRGRFSKNARKAHKRNCREYCRFKECIKSMSRPLLRMAYPSLIMDDIVKVEPLG